MVAQLKTTVNSPASFAFKPVCVCEWWKDMVQWMNKKNGAYPAGGYSSGDLQRRRL